MACIMAAIRTLDLDLLEKIISSSNADINQKEDSGMTPLMLASLYQRHDITKMLLRYGAIVTKDVLDIEYTLFAVELRFGKHHNLSTHTIKLFKAIENNDHLEVQNILHEHYDDIDIVYPNYATPLYLAIYHRNLKITKLLIEHGASLIIKNHYDLTPYMYAQIHLDSSEHHDLLDYLECRSL